MSAFRETITSRHDGPNSRNLNLTSLTVDPSIVIYYIYSLNFLAVSQGRTCRPSPPPPLKKDHLKKVVMNGAECSE